MINKFKTRCDGCRKCFEEIFLVRGNKFCFDCLGVKIISEIGQINIPGEYLKRVGFLRDSSVRLIVKGKHIEIHNLEKKK